MPPLSAEVGRESSHQFAQWVTREAAVENTAESREQDVIGKSGGFAKPPETDIMAHMLGCETRLAKRLMTLQALS